MLFDRREEEEAINRSMRTSTVCIRTGNLRLSQVSHLHFFRFRPLSARPPWMLPLVPSAAVFNDKSWRMDRGL